MKKIFYYLAWLVIILGIGFTLLTMFWNYYPYHIIDIHLQPNPVVIKQIHAGEKPQWKVDNCDFTEGVKADVSYSLIGDNRIIFLPPTIYVTKKGCYNFIGSPITLPIDLAPAMYHAEATVIYHINPIRDITIHTRTEEFEVIK